MSALPHRCLLIASVLCGALPLQAQEIAAPSADLAAQLASHDTMAAANKRLVYDFFREVLEGGHIELADNYLTEGYVQHNPNVPTGRAGFVAFFSRFAKPQPIASRIKAPLVALVAEGDKVVISFAQTLPDPTKPGQTYTTTWFDMFRIEHGKLAEHWDGATRESH
jgi:predicted SnoaL-like aldol condensation-catalyzing enzyme